MSYDVMPPKTRSRPLMLLAVLTLFPLVGREPVQQPIPPVLRRERVYGPTIQDQVMLYDPVTRKQRAIYQSNGHIPGEVSISPDGMYASFVEAFTVSPGVVRNRLVVIDVRGALVRAIDDKPVGTYSWCCGTGIVAVITGPPTEDGDVGFSPDALYLIDISTGAAQGLEGILGLPYQLHWSSVDSALYIKTLPTASGAKIYRYDAQTQRLVLTPHKGVFFSPDGLYYFDWHTQGFGFHLYRAADDVEITGQLAAQIGPEIRWVPGAGHVLVFIEKPVRGPSKTDSPGRVVATDRSQRVAQDRWNRAVDAETKRLVQRFQGDIKAGWRTSAPVLPIEGRAGVELIPPRRP